MTAGIIIDSFLPDGSQKLHPGIPLLQAQSIANPCLSRSVTAAGRCR
ncbi:Phospho-2-dehydro-3-deoxyheptonate aldolase, Trp-sensitive [Erwinia amylovora Ea644]|nr:Phospho-2-dehydro-3-deoxyheptonate aldolase, Trp-sensitive [Erwinia amylovora Ea644]CCP07111.1 hypothetical protein BN440_2086 [Erwinia amylovora MR1]